MSASSNFIASQWWRPSGDLPDNLTGITFESRDYAKPQITLPPAYKALQAGQTIAIKSATGKRFVQMDSEEIKTTTDMGSSTRFTVINVGNGDIALHSKRYNRFISMNDSKIEASAVINAYQLPDDSTSERFKVINAGNGEVDLYNAHWDRFLRMNGETMKASQRRCLNEYQIIEPGSSCANGLYEVETHADCMRAKDKLGHTYIPGKENQSNYKINHQNNGDTKVNSTDNSSHCSFYNDPSATTWNRVVFNTNFDAPNNTITGNNSWQARSENWKICRKQPLDSSCIDDPPSVEPGEPVEFTEFEPHQGWDARAVSKLSFSRADTSGVRGVSFTIPTTDKRVVVGLRRSSSESWQQNDFQLLFVDDGSMRITELGSSKGDWFKFGRYKKGSVGMVKINEEGKVEYLVDGELIYTSVWGPSYPVNVDLRYGSTGTELQDIKWVDRDGSEGKFVMVADPV